MGLFEVWMEKVSCLSDKNRTKKYVHFIIIIIAFRILSACFSSVHQIRMDFNVIFFWSSVNNNMDNIYMYILPKIIKKKAENMSQKEREKKTQTWKWTSCPYVISMFNTSALLIIFGGWWQCWWEWEEGWLGSVGKIGDY